MGSLFVKSNKMQLTKNIFGQKEKLPVYLQFVPGYVVDVVTSETSLWFTGEATINSIMAIPHMTDKLYKRRSNIDENNRYFPLLRGMNDVPVKGDPVLLCTFGNTNYYFGPLNTDNNPNYNYDYLIQPEPSYDPKYMNNIHTNEKFQELLKESQFGRSGRDKAESYNFGKTAYRRLAKKYSKPNNDEAQSLDHPRIIDEEGNPHVELDEESGLPLNRAIRDIHGDMIFEGRHGNSIRIGSRHIDPYIIISNDRNTDSNEEGLTDGTLISITKYGTLAQHFGGITGEDRVNPRDPETDEGPGTPELMKQESFILSSDVATPQITNMIKWRSMSDLVALSPITGSEPQGPPAADLIYKYRKNQTFLNSRRITINAYGEGNAPAGGGDIFLSSAQDIHIGTGRNLTISTNESTLFESRNIYIGKKAIDKKEPFVLGNELVTLLTDLIDCLSQAHFLSPVGNPLPVIDSTSTPITKPGAGRKGLDDIKKGLEKIISWYHFIEPNDKTEKNSE